MSDLISRADAIDACCRGWNNTVEDCIRNIKEIPSAWYRGMECAQDIISAQPSADTSSDSISRADAICEVLVNDGIDNIVDRINALPSADVIEFDFNKYQPRVRNKVNDGTPSAETLQNLTEPNNTCEVDLISRADAIEAVDERWGDIKRTNKRVAKGHEAVYLDMRATISELPSADAAQGEWIQYSERPPKEKQEVYVTVYFTEGDTGRAYGYIDGFGKWHLYSAVEGVLNSGYKVTAWMPLPTPYKGGAE